MSPRRLFPLLVALAAANGLSACPWCLTNGVKATVTREMADPGGRFFGSVPDPRKTRHYFITAERTPWLYVPLRRDPTTTAPLPAALRLNQPVGKLRYFAYTDGTFATRSLETERVGLLGPVLRGVAGEYLVVTFLNRTDRPVSMHPHGVKYDKDSEGAYYQPAPGKGAAVAPGATFTYVWLLDAASGPLPTEPSSKAWLYHSHVHGQDEITDGLVGFIVVTDPKRARRDGTPNDVDREEAALFLIHPSGPAEEELEEGLPFMEGRLADPAKAPPPSPLPSGGLAAGTAAMELAEGWHAINGYAYANLPGLEMNEGERVRWYLFGLGSETDVHTAHWHGARAVAGRDRGTDVVELLPGSMKVADTVMDNPGTWLFHCHVADHMMQGMSASYVVHPRRSATPASVQVDDAFFGVTQPAPSLRLRVVSAPASLTRPDETHPLRIEGVMSVPSGLALAGPSLELRLGTHTATLSLNERGVGAAEGATFRSLDEHPLGLVLGNQVRFELAVTDPRWLEGVRKSRPIPVELKLGSVTHRATFRLLR